MTRPGPMAPADLARALTRLPRWCAGPDGLQRQFRFASFSGAMAFMAACVQGIEERDHHPEWSNTYNTVAVTLRTHDAGGKITALDVDLAHHMEQILAAGGSEFGYAEAGRGPQDAATENT